MQQFDGPPGTNNPGTNNPGANNTEPDKAVIKDGDMSSFMADVIEKSAALPVLVYFYSSWSENCKLLSPLLERIVTRAAGTINMVRIDFEENQQLAAQMKIQSVPTVVVFSGQRPVDAFAGTKSEAEITEFIARFAPGLQPSPTEQMITGAAELFETDDYQGAGEIYSHILQAEPENAAALAGLAQCLIKLGDLEKAATVLGDKEDSHPALQAARAALDMAQQFSGLEQDTTALEQAILADENDHQARFDLALILWAGGNRQEAAGHLLDIISRDRAWNDDGARKQLVKFFDMAGPTDPFTVATRRKLSSILFS